MVVCTSGVVKTKDHLTFVENSEFFVLKIELLFTMLFKFEREVALKDSAFSWVGCLTHKVLWSVYSFWINLISFALHIVFIFVTITIKWCFWRYCWWWEFFPVFSWSWIYISLICLNQPCNRQWSRITVVRYSC